MLDKWTYSAGIFHKEQTSVYQSRWKPGYLDFQILTFLDFLLTWCHPSAVTRSDLASDDPDVIQKSKRESSYGLFDAQWWQLVLLLALIIYLFVYFF